MFSLNVVYYTFQIAQTFYIYSSPLHLYLALYGHIYSFSPLYFLQFTVSSFIVHDRENRIISINPSWVRNVPSSGISKIIWLLGRPNLDFILDGIRRLVECSLHSFLLYMILVLHLFRDVFFCLKNIIKSLYL